MSKVAVRGRGAPARSEVRSPPKPETSAHSLDDLRAGTTKSLNAALLERLREDLLSGRIVSGTKLKISDFCTQYEVSPGVVREALARLVPEGLVDFIDQRGFRAPRVTAAGMLDITRVRCLIEREALIESMRNGDETWESKVVAAHYRLQATSPDDSELARTRHKEFHQALIAACISPWLIRLHDVLYNQTERYRAISARARANPGGPKRDVAAEHRKLVDAVLRRDEKRAIRLMEAHLRKTAEIVVDVVRSVRST